MAKVSRFFLIISLILCLPACATKQSRSVRAVKHDGPPKRIPKNIHKTPNAKPKVEPLSRRGNRYGKSNSYVIFNKRYHVKKTSRGYREQGLASWYGKQFHGRKTSNGEQYNMFAMTAAHKTLPLPTYLKVTNLKNKKSIIVKVNDRGPFHQNRIIDLSYAAAAKLGMLGNGTARVEIESVDPRDNGWKRKNRRTANKSPFAPKSTYKIKEDPTQVKPSTTTLKKSPYKNKPSITKVKPNTTIVKKSPYKTKPNTTEIKPSTTTIKKSPYKTKPSTTKVKPSTTTVKKSPYKTKPNTTKIKANPTKIKRSPYKIKPTSSLDGHVQIERR